MKITKLIKKGFLVIGLLYLQGCGSYNNVNKNPSIVGDINDKDEWYNIEKDSVTEMKVNFEDPNEYLCSPYTNPAAEPRPCTFEDVNNDLDPEDTYKPTLHVNMQTPDYQNTSQNNAKMSVKGNYTRRLPQKSYTVKLDNTAPLYMQQRKFPLTKSESDRSRLRNKVAFTLLHKVPNIIGLPVNFFHLIINGEDYGLFNQAESIRKEFLIRRGWNENDHLYNTVNFTFKYDNYFMALNAKGEPLYPARFKHILEVKTGKDNTKLIEMLKAVETTNDIDSVIAKYFNRKNYLTWLAMNLILGDKDTIQHNYYLYNPLYSDTFYFLPWDYDGAWSIKKYLKRYEYGISLWWEVPLHRKFLSIKKNREDLYKLIDELRTKYITDKAVQAIVDKYLPLVLPYQGVEPDSKHNSQNYCQKTAQQLITRIQENIDLFKSVIGSPMPFDENVTYDSATKKISIGWGKSVDLEGDTIVYDVNISKKSLDNIIFSEQNLTQYSLEKTLPLSAGTYYLRVMSKEKNNPKHFQYSYSYIKDNNGIHDGYLEFSVK